MKHGHTHVMSECPTCVVYFEVFKQITWVAVRHGCRGGLWNSGGQCHKETKPIFSDSHLQEYPLKMRILESVISESKIPVVFMNISKLTNYRKDAHPSIYFMEHKTKEEWKPNVGIQDCVHWCLPGVPDTWNELLYVSLLKYGKGSWKN